MQPDGRPLYAYKWNDGYYERLKGISKNDSLAVKVTDLASRVLSVRT